MPTAKTCTRCGTTKPLDEFPKQRAGRYGRAAACKACHSAQMRQRRALESQEERDARLAGYRRYQLISNYGITPEEFDRLLDAQGGRCAICGATDPRGRVRGSRMHVDHDHATGRVRGLLCFPCNSGMGHFEDDASRLGDAIAYLEKHGRAGSAHA